LGEAQKALELAGKFSAPGESEVRSLVLDPDSGLVYHPSNPAPYGGAYVLVPTAGNFEKIHAAVRGLLFAAEEEEGEE